MEMTVMDQHLSDDTLESCARGRLNQNTTPAVFEHLMACDDCSARLDAEVEFRSAFQEASWRLQQEKVTASQRSRWSSFLLQKPVWAAGLAMLLLMTVVPMLRQGTGPVQIVELKATRGSESVRVAAGQVHLRLDTAGLDLQTAAKAQIADANGREIWNGPAAEVKGVLEVAPPVRLSAGTYWVRVYGNNSADMLREFKLTVE